MVTSSYAIVGSRLQRITFITFICLFCLLLPSPCSSVNPNDESAFWNACENCLESSSENWFCVQQGANFASTYECQPQSVKPSDDDDLYTCLYESSVGNACANLYCTQITVESQCNSTASYAGQQLECIWDNGSCTNTLAEALEGLGLIIIVWILLGICCCCGIGFLAVAGPAVVLTACVQCFQSHSVKRAPKKETVIIQSEPNMNSAGNSPYVQMGPPPDNVYANTMNSNIQTGSPPNIVYNTRYGNDPYVAQTTNKV